jgi:hypothetical protein
VIHLDMRLCHLSWFPEQSNASTLKHFIWIVSAVVY